MGLLNSFFWPSVQVGRESQGSLGALGELWGIFWRSFERSERFVEDSGVSLQCPLGRFWVPREEHCVNFGVR